jgi:hypothetical protein
VCLRRLVHRCSLNSASAHPSFAGSLAISRVHFAHEQHVATTLAYAISGASIARIGGSSLDRRKPDRFSVFVSPRHTQRIASTMTRSVVALQNTIHSALRASSGKACVSSKSDAARTSSATSTNPTATSRLRGLTRVDNKQSRADEASPRT